MNDENQRYLWQRRYDIKLRALMNRFYYQERLRIFECREGFIKAFSILLGSVAFANVSDQVIIKWCALLITFFTTISLVFGFGNKARDSAKRSTEWTLLEKDIEQVGERDFTEDHINQWAARANELEAGEPSAHKILLEKCLVRAEEALGGQSEKRELTFFQKYIPPIMIP
jgi:hypothetical protein